MPANKFLSTVFLSQSLLLPATLLINNYSWLSYRKILNTIVWKIRLLQSSSILPALYHYFVHKQQCFCPPGFRYCHELWNSWDFYPLFVSQIHLPVIVSWVLSKDKRVIGQRQRTSLLTTRAVVRIWVCFVCVFLGIGCQSPNYHIVTHKCRWHLHKGWVAFTEEKLATPKYLFGMCIIFR